MDSLQHGVPGPSEAQLGRTLRELRGVLGLEVEELAGRCGLASDEIEALEGGSHGADVATLRRVTQALGIGMGTLFAICERQFPLPPQG